MNVKCSHNHSAPVKLMKDLPITQAGISRHKCAVCAYEEGYLNGYNDCFKLILEHLGDVPKSKEEILKARSEKDSELIRKIAQSIKEKSKG